MKITIKRLEIIFVIVYFLTIIACTTALVGLECLKSVTAGFLVSIGDWYLLKLMAKKWLKKGRYSLLDSMLRFFLIGVSLWVLLVVGVYKVGLIIGVSIIPVSLMIIGMVSFFRKIEV